MGEDSAGSSPLRKGTPGLASLLLGYLSVFAHLLPRPHVGVRQKGERGQRWAGVSGFQVEAGARQVFAEEAALLEFGPEQQGAEGCTELRATGTLGWGGGSPCVLVGTLVSLWDGPHGQVVAERAKCLAWHGGGYNLASWAVLGGWSGVMIPEVQDAPPHPNICPFNSCCFQQGFSLSSPYTSQGRGPEWGTGHRMLVSKGDCPWTDTQSGCSPACLRLCSGQPSPPMDTG